MIYFCDIILGLYSGCDFVLRPIVSSKMYCFKFIIKCLTKYGVRMNPPAALNLKNTRDASRTWKKFKQSWMIYETASGTVSKDPAVRLATFLHVAGEDAVEKYNGFTFNSEEERSSLEAVIAKFDKDCQSTVNVQWLKQLSYHQD